MENLLCISVLYSLVSKGFWPPGVVLLLGLLGVNVIGTMALAITEAMMLINIAQVSHVATDASIDFDVFFVSSEKSNPRLSQKARYGIVKSVRTIMLKAPSNVDPKPSIR